ncbi:hypothetical protein BaRGS_00022542 [Batillaria attramentaria]|uniref:RING-type E3 ubiquitin transferase n=1 Tax=Batillaria attramentaria TaxID=370345 RepID=A0ABD0KGI3_9CAEN
MSRHEGVSCDSCLKGNFRGRRYKCLICYDYDLCSTCYEAGATTTRHTTDHPMQCILTRSDFDMYYGGEALTAEQPQSFTCPYCCKMGFTDATLHEHVTAEHTDVSLEVVCPICASLPGGDPNHVTDDFASHLALEHRTPRDFISFPTSVQCFCLRHVRRIPHPGRGGGSRTRRANMHFGSSANTLTGLSPSGRENMDPIAELLSQLSSVRNRAAAAQSVSSQLQQLEMQLQSTRQQLERMPRRQAEANKAPANNANSAALANPESILGSQTQASSSSDSQFLLAKITDESSGSGNSNGNESERVERNMFVQELLLSTLTEQLQLATHAEDPFNLLDSLRSPAPEAEQKKSGAGSETGSGAVPSASRKEGGGSSKSLAVEVHCKSKSSCANAMGPPSNAASSSSSNTGGKPASVPASVAGSAHQEGRGGLLGAAAAAASPAGVASSHSSMVAHPAHSPRPTQVAAAVSPPALQQPQPQGPSVSLSVQHEHGMPLARPAAGSMSPRDTNRLNPAAAKRSMLKHLPASRGATDTDPPPH